MTTSPFQQEQLRQEHVAATHPTLLHPISRAIGSGQKNAGLKPEYVRGKGNNRGLPPIIHIK
jgi:hypothetical protein